MRFNPALGDWETYFAKIRTMQAYHISVASLYLFCGEIYAPNKKDEKVFISVISSYSVHCTIQYKDWHLFYSKLDGAYLRCDKPLVVILFLQHKECKPLGKVFRT